ncbi:MAG: imidazoleglycerol-phosphate dehydratase HisB [Asgard group archaeon]|nr:imidazoleglycerol-phosphate dehydratase HisB [Asgard group archaeon]
MNRKSKIKRETKETSIKISLNIDGTGDYSIDTGIPMFDHLLEQIAIHGIFDLDIQAKSDLSIDTHHCVEDVGIVLGQIFKEALHEKKGIKRVGSCYLPMDETLVLIVLDLSNRPYFSLSEIPWEEKTVGGIPPISVTLIEHFLHSFATNSAITLHVKVLSGKNNHHIAEALFKALGRALDEASRIDPKRKGLLPSSKGTLSDTFQKKRKKTG